MVAKVISKDFYTLSQTFVVNGKTVTVYFIEFIGSAPNRFMASYKEGEWSNDYFIELLDSHFQEESTSVKHRVRQYPGAYVGCKVITLVSRKVAMDRFKAMCDCCRNELIHFK